MREKKEYSGGNRTGHGAGKLKKGTKGAGDVNPQRLGIIFLSVAILLCLFGCGKKGDPFLPQNRIYSRVVDLEGTWTGKDVYLEGRVKGRDNRGPEPIVAVRVSQARFALDDSPCVNCPIPFGDEQDFGLEVIAGEKFSCTIPIQELGKLYYFRVQFLGPNGTMGPPSWEVRVVVPQKE
jgi:hypothetical protein